MNIVITGGAGYLGSVLTRKILNMGATVKVIDNLIQGGHSLLGVIDHPKLFFYNADVREEMLIREVIRGSDVVIHLAGIVGDPACAADEKLAYSVNVVGSENVFNACRVGGVKKIIFASTCSNYGMMDKEKYEYVDESSDLAPVSLYATHKVEMEKLLIGGYEDLNPTIFRFSTLYGISPRMRFDLTANQFVMEAFVNGKLLIYGEQFYRPYLHVLDATTAIWIVLGSKAVGSNIWNVGDNSENYTKKDIVSKIKRVMPMGKLEVEYINKEEDPRDYKVSFNKIKQDLVFKTKYNVNFGIMSILKLLAAGVIGDPKSNKWRN